MDMKEGLFREKLSGIWENKKTLLEFNTLSELNNI
jgi:hypothetical protein